MRYTIEVFDQAGLRRAMLHETPLLEVRLGGADEDDIIRGLLPAELEQCAPGWLLRITLEGRKLIEAPVERVLPQWGDTKRLILDRYVSFHQLLEIHARCAKSRFDGRVSGAFASMRIDGIACALINRAPGRVHYTVAHEAYPQGAQRENAKFLERSHAGNALEIGGIGAGQWAGGGRVDASAAYAKDGNTIAGLRVDGAAWPDLRLMMVAAEEAGLSPHVIKRHPETADWDDARYAASGYALRGHAAKAFLQELIDSKGIEAIELNAHLDQQGMFDDRVDANGRYLGLVYGGGECFNAAMVECGHAEVCLHDEGRRLAPELALKEFYSYRGSCKASLAPCAAVLQAFDADAQLLGLLAALAYAAPGLRLKLDASGCVSMCDSAGPDHVIWHDPLETAVIFGAENSDQSNLLFFQGNPLRGGASAVYSREDSRDAHGDKPASLRHFAFSTAEDAQRLAGGLLDDLAYPGAAGMVECFRGRAEIAAGDLVELRGAPLRRVVPVLQEEQGGRFSDRLVARAVSVRHRFMGRRVETRCELGPPLRSARDALSFLVRGQRSEESLYELRLDDVLAGADAGLHLD